MDACPRANEVLHKKLNEAIDAIEKGDAHSFDKALEDMVKTRKSNLAVVRLYQRRKWDLRKLKKRKAGSPPLVQKIIPISTANW